MTGFKVVTRLFNDADLSAVNAAIAAGFSTVSKAGARHLMGVPAVQQLANDPRLMELASEFVGPSPYPFRATFFDKSPEKNWLVAWHQDTALPLQERNESAEWGPWSVKTGVLYAHAPAHALERVIALRVSLDPSTEANGPLRVIPNSHSLGVLTDEQMERLSHETQQVECVTERGGVVVMRPLIVHASSKAREPLPRRVLHIEYTEDIQIAPGVTLATA